jgi:protein-disulfide isomerase
MMSGQDPTSPSIQRSSCAKFLAEPSDTGHAMATFNRRLRQIAVASLGMLALSACHKPARPAGAIDPGSFADDWTQGSPNAPVSLIEYASPTCPQCKVFNDTILPTLKSKYVDAGKVYYIFREYTKHPQLDVPVFLLAHCVEKGTSS